MQFCVCVYLCVCIHTEWNRHLAPPADRRVVLAQRSSQLQRLQVADFETASTQDSETTARLGQHFAGALHRHYPFGWFDVPFGVLE